MNCYTTIALRAASAVVALQLLACSEDVFVPMVCPSTGCVAEPCTALTPLSPVAAPMPAPTADVFSPGQGCSVMVWEGDALPMGTSHCDSTYSSYQATREPAVDRAGERVTLVWVLRTDGTLATDPIESIATGTSRIDFDSHGMLLHWEVTATAYGQEQHFEYLANVVDGQVLQEDQWETLRFATGGTPLDQRFCNDDTFQKHVVRSLLDGRVAAEEVRGGAADTHVSSTTHLYNGERYLGWTLVEDFTGAPSAPPTGACDVEGRIYTCSSSIAYDGDVPVAVTSYNETSVISNDCCADQCHAGGSV